MSVKWTTDPVLESKLRQLGVSFKLETGISMSGIDVHGSRKNNARLRTEWNEELSVEYGVAMADGDAFPAVVLRATEGGFKFFVLSGNHRVGAAKLLDETTIDAYLIESSDEMVFQIITRAANRWMGDRQSKDEAVEHARELIRRYGRTQTEMARLFGLKPAWLAKALRAEDVRDDLGRLGIENHAMPRSVLEQLSKLTDNERVFRKAGYLAASYSLSGDRVRDLAAAVDAQRTESDQIDAIKMFEDALREERPIPAAPRSVASRRPQRSKLYQYVTTLSRFLKAGNRGREFETLDQIGVTDVHDRHNLRQHWREIRKTIDTLFHLSDIKHGNQPAKKKVKA